MATNQTLFKLECWQFQRWWSPDGATSIALVRSVDVTRVLAHGYPSTFSATVLVAFAFQGPPSGTHSHKTYEAVTFPGNSSSVDLKHGCLSVLMCRWRVWEFFIEDALCKFTFWFDLIHLTLTKFRTNRVASDRYFGYKQSLIGTTTYTVTAI